jgi:hypothetical protein
MTRTERGTSVLPGPGGWIGPALAIALAVAMAAPALAAPTKVDGGIQFTYADPNAASVTWAGEFNGWNATASPMAKGGDGTWSIVIPLPPGKHQYKFVVDGQWIADPENGVTAGDYGNSVVTRPIAPRSPSADGRSGSTRASTAAASTASR